MTEAVLAIDVIANCADGSVYDNVVMKLIEDQIIFETHDGHHLCGDCCVKTFDKIAIAVDPLVFASAIAKYRQQEET